MSTVKTVLNKKIQIITLGFSSQYEELEQEITLDNRVNFLEKITIASADFFPAPASISAIEIDGSSSLVEKGTLVGHFQNLLGQNDLKLDYQLSKSQIKIKITAKDESSSFSAYSLQFALHLDKV